MDCRLARIISVNRDPRPVRRVPAAGACGSFFTFRAASGSVCGHGPNSAPVATGVAPLARGDRVHAGLTEASARRGRTSGGRSKHRLGTVGSLAHCLQEKGGSQARCERVGPACGRPRLEGDGLGL